MQWTIITTPFPLDEIDVKRKNQYSPYKPITREHAWGLDIIAVIVGYECVATRIWSSCPVPPSRLRC